MTPYKVELPWPVSANRYWRRAGKVIHTSNEARQYRRDVAMLVRDAPCFGRARIGVAIVVFPPDNRRRDLDNLQKVLLDALQHAGVFEDDSQVDDLWIVRGNVRKPDGAAFVAIRYL